MTVSSTAHLKCGLALLLAFALCPLAPASAPSLGEQIYRSGVLQSGKALEGEREGGAHISGPTAACVNCHRRSGLGMKEGRASIPPIAGSYLFHPRATAADSLDLPYVEGMKADRDPYTEATLARAIREGVGADGKLLSYLMPRFRIDDSEMAALIAYLKTLSPGAVPGVTDGVLHFATIVTPDADPARRKGVLEVLDKFFIDKNRRTRAESPRLQSSHRLRFMANRHWELHVWELQGAPETWEAQLKAKLAAEPVFAVLSGVGGRTWAPVHRFCEEEALPCLFPNVELPVDAQNDFDDLYFSKGVLLETELIAHDLKEMRNPSASRRVVQVYRSNDVGRDAADALKATLADAGFTFVNRSLAPNASARELTAAIHKTDARDALILWLRPDDVAALGAAPAHLSEVYLSGRMAGLEQAQLPADWRSITRLAYPVDLPEKRRVRVDFALGWFRIRQIPVVALEAQADTYLACSIVSDTLNHMADTFVRDYLVERIEEMLEHRIITGYYPRLSLAPGQRFASKGGFLVHFANPTGSRVTPDTAWIVP